MARMPPLRRLERAETTTAPLGAKVMARSSWTGGLVVFGADPGGSHGWWRGSRWDVAAGGDIDLAVPGAEDVDR